jgi:hypothetical protein
MCAFIAYGIQRIRLWHLKNAEYVFMPLTLLMFYKRGMRVLFVFIKTGDRFERRVTRSAYCLH